MDNKDIKKQVEILRKNIVDEKPAQGLDLQLRLSDKPLIIKAGFDPTAPDIHLGHAVILRKLRQFQDLGHKVVLIVGDYTARIGDPSGRLKTRPILSNEEIVNNARSYIEQAGKILITNKSDLFEIIPNSKWFSGMNLEDFLNLMSHITVARIIEREDFSKRLKDNEPIALHEIIYPLFQGFDSFKIKANVEVGGTDQLFNMLVGRDVQKTYYEKGDPVQTVITMPLLVGLDGVNKMSKSLGNYIGITESPDSMYGKVMSIPDALIENYFKLCLDKEISADDITKDPMAKKKELAFGIVELYHSKDDAQKAQDNFKKIVQDKEAPSDIEEMEIAKGTKLIDILKQMEVAESNSEANRLIEQGGVEIDGQKVMDKNLVMENDCTIKAGKRNYRKIITK